MRFTSLSGKWNGDYTLEGDAPEGAVDVLFALLEELKQLPSNVRLSYWRDGASGKGDYKFAFRGRLVDVSPAPLPPLESAAATELLKAFASLAKQRGLCSITARDPIAMPAPDESGERRRLKIWANGTHRQIADYVDAVSGSTNVVVGEVVVVPMSPADSKPGIAQFSAAIDVFVRQHAPTP